MQIIIEAIVIKVKVNFFCGGYSALSVKDCPKRREAQDCSVALADLVESRVESFDSHCGVVLASVSQVLDVLERVIGELTASLLSVVHRHAQAVKVPRLKIFEVLIDRSVDGLEDSVDVHAVADLILKSLQRCLVALRVNCRVQVMQGGITRVNESPFLNSWLDVRLQHLAHSPAHRVVAVVIALELSYEFGAECKVTEQLDW
jgi:hypothetical protein